MVLLLRAGRVYWLVTDFWEKFYAVPVMVSNSMLVWELGDGEREEYPLRRRGLFRSQRKAERTAARLNRRAFR
ncbi:MAG: hypothetical protein FWB91_00030 [Defluviitaleaceae bacterium]|nr:hypothetical protein [Defluviitaleaceae bacterium]